MKIVIDIDEHIYEQVMADSEVYVLDNEVDRILIENAIYNGEPLPEKHGRLIDADELYGDFIDGTEGYDCNTWNRIEIGDIIEDAPTIIEGSESE